MSIIIGADFVPTKTNTDLFISGDADTLVGKKLKKILESADFRIFNLETPLADSETPIPKGGPNLIAPTATVNGYKAMKVDLLTLANNHILDQGEEGLSSTLTALDGVGISYVGVGDTTDAAARPFVFSYEGRKIGVYACVEHEFSTASDDSAGANPFDTSDSFDAVCELDGKCDYVIVLYHGGKEYHRYPSPQLQKTCRRFIDKGADLVICQHSHCVGCEEKYNGGTVVYGQGNFLFDYSNHECWQTGILVELDSDLNVSYIPIEKEKNKVRLAEGRRATAILEGFNGRSEEIKNPQAVADRYDELAESKYYDYLAALSGIKKFNIFFRVANKLSGGKLLRKYYDKRYSNKSLLTIRNIIECEAHRELILKALENHFKA